MFSILGVEVHLAKQKDAKHLTVNGLKCEDPFIVDINSDMPSYEPSSMCLLHHITRGY